MAGPWQAVRLDQVDAVPWRDTELVWRPLRHALDTRIVGIAAFTAERAGQLVVEPHRENRHGRGQEEIYLVLRGAARFTLDGETLDAPAGTLVRVAPEVQREATATVAATAVIALGGESEFVPSASEWIERARPLIRTDPARAAAIIDELRAVENSESGLLVADALLAAGRGDEVHARALLAQVLARWPQARAALADDADLAPLLPPAAAPGAV